jgi:hypothetical protein
MADRRRIISTLALVLSLAVGSPLRAEEDDAPVAAPPEAPPARRWYGVLQPSYWLGGTDAEGKAGKHGTGEAMLRLDLAIQWEPAETGLTFALGIPATLRFSFIGTDRAGDVDCATPTVMAKLKGTIRKNDLEGGFWELVAEDGEHYQLKGGGDGLCVEGQRVEVEGKVDKDAFGIGMSGPTLDVKSWKSL